VSDDDENLAIHWVPSPSASNAFGRAPPIDVPRDQCLSQRLGERARPSSTMIAASCSSSKVAVSSRGTYRVGLVWKSSAPNLFEPDAMR
jgi:hypothetical protein